MKDAERIVLEVRLTDAAAFRLFLWELKQLVAEMQEHEDYRYAERLDKALMRILAENE